MADVLVAVVDGSRARFFALGTRPTPSGASKPRLEEFDTLINPEHGLKDGDRYTESRPGTRAASAGGTAHGVDDGREAHADEVDGRFAKRVLNQLAEHIRDHGALEVILAAGPKMLGHLRASRASLPKVQIGELPKHLTELSAHDLCTRLEKADLI